MRTRFDKACVYTLADYHHQLLQVASRQIRKLINVTISASDNTLGCYYRIQTVQYCAIVVTLSGAARQLKASKLTNMKKHKQKLILPTLRSALSHLDHRQGQI